MQIVPFAVGAVHRHDGGNRHAWRNRQDVDDRLALGCAPAQRQPPCLELVDHAIGCEEQKLVMGIGHEEGGHDILFLGLHPGQALAAAFLRAEIGQRRALDVTARGDGDDHILSLDQILVIHVAGPIDDLGPAGDGEELLHLAQLVRDDAHDPLAAGQNLKVFADLGRQFLQLVRDFLDAQLGQALQTQFKNGASLNLGQEIGAVLVHRVGRVVDQADVFGNVARGPGAGHQLVTRICRIGRGTDRGHHLIDIGDGHGQTAEDMAALARLAQLIGGAAGDHFLAEGDEAGQEAQQGQLLRAATVQRQHVAAEIGLHRGETVKLVQHHLGRGIALEFDDHAHAVAVAFILHMGDAFDLLLAHLFRDLLDHRGLVHLIGNLLHDDGVAVLAQLLDLGLGADDDAAAPLKIGFARTGAAQHQAAGRKIRAGDEFDEVFGGQVRVVDKGQRGIHHLAQVMRRDVGRHADGDPARAIDQHVRETRRQNRGFAVLAVIVVLKVDRVLVDIGQQESGGLVHAHFGIAHRGGVIAIHRAEVALTVQKRQRHREILRHPHQRVIDRAIAVGMVFTHHVTDGARRFAVRFVVGIAHFVHGIEDAAVHGFQTVTQIGNRAGDDHAHRVIEIGGLHLLGDRDGGAIEDDPRGRVFVFVFRGFRRVVHVI